MANFLSLALLAACSAGIGELAYDGNTPAALKVIPDNSVMGINTEYNFRAIATYANGTRRDVTDEVQWEVEDVGALKATKGLMRFNQLGPGRIRARYQKFSDDTTVRVINAVLTRIEVEPVNRILPQASAQQFRATAYFNDNTHYDVTSQVTWRSSNLTVATVSDDVLSKGLVRGLVTGTSVIRAEMGTSSGQTLVSVNSASLVSLSVDPAMDTLASGVEKDFRALGTYSDGTVVDLSSVVTWTSSSSGNALVDGLVNRGRVRGLIPGRANIRASLDALDAESQVFVTSAVLVSLEMTPSTLSLAQGTTQVIRLTGIYSDGSTVDLTSLAAWASSNSSVMSVDPNGGVTALGTGPATVTASFGGRTQTISVSGTTAGLTGIDVTPFLINLPLGQSLQLAATGRFSDGTTQDITSQAVWSTSSASHATVSNAAGTRGVLNSVAIGAAQIMATYSGMSATTDVQVTAASLVSLVFSQSQLTLADGAVSTISAWANYSDGTVADVSSSVLWSSTDSSVATVGNAAGTYGQITGVNPGSATIRGSYQGAIAQLSLTISNAELTGIAITPSSTILPLGAVGTMRATASYTDGSTSDVTNTVLWSSTNQNVATVSNAAGQKGKVSPVAQGSTFIRAAHSGFQAQATLTVNAATLDRIEISPQSLALAQGTTQQLTATGIYTDGSTIDLTSLASWASSNAAVLSVDNSAGRQGLATATGVGNATITVNYNGVSQSLSATGSSAILTSLEFSPPTLTLASGTSQQMRVTGIYSDGSTVDLTAQASWSSTNSSVMSVTNAGANRGTVTSVGPGSATLSVSYQGVSSSMSATMTNATLVALQINPATLSIPAGNTANFTVSGQFSDQTVQDLTNEASWASSDVNVAVVSNAAGQKGHMEAKAPGPVEITAAARGLSAVSSVTVSAATLASVSASVASVSLPSGTATQVIAWGHYSDGTTVDVTDAAVWDSSSPSVATVGSAAGTFGKITAVSQGNATVTATLLSYSAHVDVTVASANLHSIQVNAVATVLPKGLQTQFSAVGTYSDGSTADLTSSVLWSSSSITVASVSNAAGSKGLVTANAVGTSSIKAALSGVEATLGLTVTAAALDHIELNPASLALARGLTQQMTATGVYTDGTTADLTSSVAWSSSNSSVIAVSNSAGSRGLVTASGTGAATLTGTLNGVSESITVTVTSATLASVAVSGLTGPMAKGTTKQLVATGTYTDGSTQDITATASWSSSDASIASVSNSAGTRGLITGNNVGQATITAALSGFSGPLAVDVSSAHLVSITVTPGTPSVAVGLNVQLVATGSYTDSTTADLSSLVTWSSSSTSLAAVSNSAGSKGRVTAVAVGNATITASYDGASGDSQVSVIAATLQSITISGLGTGLPKGQIRQLTATGTYSDGSTANVTNSVVWSSNNASVASISNAAGTRGVFTSMGIGTAQVTAALGSVADTRTATGIAAVLVSIAVTPGEVWIPISAYRQFTATGTYSDGTTANLTASVLWTSSDNLLMTIDNTAPNQGRARGIALGAGTFTATLGGISGSAIFHGVLY